MVRRLTTLLAGGAAAALMITAVPAAAAVDPGPTFNDPLGSTAEQFAVIDKIEQAIDATPEGETIRVAAYLLNVAETADKLIAAHGRGVDVRVVLDAHSNASPVRKLLAVLGGDPSSGSYLVRCKQTCRGGNGNMHMKIYTFSRTGDSRHVVMMGSSNLANANAVRHWNDIYTVVGDRGLYNVNVGVHRELSSDRSVGKPNFTFETGPYSYHTFPSNGSSMATDTIYQELGKVTCGGALDAGVDGSTAIKISMFAWTGRRGLYLLERLRGLESAGCHVEVTIGKGSGPIKAGLRASNIDFYDSKLDTDGNGIADKYVHTKYVLISGNHDGDPSSWKVFTGSQNWSDGGLRKADEVILGISGQEAYLAYADHFSLVRSSADPGARSAARSVTVQSDTRDAAARGRKVPLTGLFGSLEASPAGSAGIRVLIALGPFGEHFGLGSHLPIPLPALRI